MINILDDTGTNFWLSPNSSTKSQSTFTSDFRKPAAFASMRYEANFNFSSNGYIHEIMHT